MTTVVLLAAGASRRFGTACKLQAPYRGKPLVRHVAEAILASGLPAVAVTADPAVEDLLPEFRIIRSIGPQSQSLRAGLAAVDDDRALVVLGDMPHVDAALLLRIALAPAPAAASDGNRITPPASLPRSMFADIAQLSGDQGAGAVLRRRPDLYLVHVDAGRLRDIDISEDIL
ncbi:NTP transferase domain-containing protein [Paracoccus sp. S3-43]|uniref:NTP transferase domain-containing protein n=1 Tax=Paracoccus sp. S3-43 TaxID=3030011 RepID=UPI0023B0AB2A|nr:NTP transferase domain-containing protein [Paracoccus sp. S3-43]WEF24456.1 NTP transferase domain-containing protein [Paracoccus sp. S3-43]